MTKGYFYWHVKSGQQNILMYRKEKQPAVDAYQRYVRVGKNCDWLGRWNGRKFEETSVSKTK